MSTKLTSTGLLYPDGTTATTAKSSTKGIFVFGTTGTNSYVTITNSVNQLGIVDTDVSSSESPREGAAGVPYGGDKCLHGFGYTLISGVYTWYTSAINISSYGIVVGLKYSGGSIRNFLAGAGYGGDKGIFGYGYESSLYRGMTNLVSNVGIIASDVTGVGTYRSNLAATSYGGDKAIFGYGAVGSPNYWTNVTNLVSNAGVVASDTTGVGTARHSLAAASYGGDKAIFGYGYQGLSVGGEKSMTNLVSNVGVVASDTTGVGTARTDLTAVSYGGDKAIFGYGHNYGGGNINLTNLVSNVGVVASDTSGVGTARYSLSAATFGG